MRRALIPLASALALRCASPAPMPPVGDGAPADRALDASPVPDLDASPDVAPARDLVADTFGDTVDINDVSGDAMLPSIELGSGQDGWQMLPARGGRTEIVFGPQGGYHIFGRARIRGVSPGLRGPPATSGVTLRFEVTPVEGGPALTDPGGVTRWDQTGLVRTSEGAYESAFGELVILTAIRSPAEVVGRSFRFEVFLRENATGRTAADSREIVIVDERP